MSVSKKRKKDAVMPVLWIGRSSAIKEAAILCSQQQPSLLVDVELSVGITMNITTLSKGRQIDSYSISLDTRSSSFFHLKLLSFFRSFEQGLAVLEYDDSSLVFWARFFSETGIEFSLWFGEKPQISWNKWAFICAATCRIVSSEEILVWWKASFIFDAELADSAEGLVQTVVRQTPYLIDRAEYDISPVSTDGKRSLTLVSYYMPPVKSVAMQRMAYWHEELQQVSVDQSFPVTPVVLTATNHYSHPENIRVIRDFGDLLPYSNEYKLQFDTLRENTINTIGLSWAQNIRLRIMRDPEQFRTEHVLFSGNPFFYFELGELYKSLFGAGVILDFRDPFAFNPRIKFSEKQRKILRSLELAYLKNADAILAVNQSCLDLISKADDRDVRRVEIANGFDERILDSVKPAKTEKSDRIQFIYAGTFYNDCSAIDFAGHLDPEKHSFVHYGKRQRDHDSLLNIEAFDWRGPADYKDVIAHIKSSHIGLIFTGGQPFEHTTKIFDYIGADIEVLIVTEGAVQTGEIHNLTKHLDGVYWIENKPAAIQSFLDSYKPVRPKRSERQTFARRAQAEQVIRLLSEINSDGVKPAQHVEDLSKLIEPNSGVAELVHRSRQSKTEEQIHDEET